MSINSSNGNSDGTTGLQPTTTDDSLVFKEPVDVYFDGSHSNGKNLSAIGFEITDATGRVLARDNFEIDYTTSVQTEFQALIHALEVATELGIRNLRIYGDCTSVIELARGDTQTTKDDLGAITEKAQNLISHFDTSYITHIKRTENTIADGLSHTALDHAAD